MSDERTQRAEEALNAVLKPLGTNLKHYMAVHRDESIEAMRKVLTDERARCATILRRQRPLKPDEFTAGFIENVIAAIEHPRA